MSKKHKDSLVPIQQQFFRSTSSSKNLQTYEEFKEHILQTIYDSVNHTTCDTPEKAFALCNQILGHKLILQQIEQQYIQAVKELNK
jgi:hypothetical protein